MTELNSAMLALQLLGGLKIYEAHICSPNEVRQKIPTRLLFRSMEPYAVGDFAVCQARNLFLVAEIVAEVEDFDFEELSDLGWLLGKVNNPNSAFSALSTADRRIKQKIVQARAMAEANRILEAAGLTSSDLSGLLALAGKTDAPS